MEYYLQAVAMILITALFGILLDGEGRRFVPIVSLAACCMIFWGMVRYLEPMLDLLKRIQELADISAQMLSVLVKAVGISMIARLAQTICKDAGQNALAGAVGILSDGVLLWISIPLVEELLELMQEVLGRV